MANFFHSISNKSDKEYYHDLIEDVECEAVSDYDEKYKFLVMGHTHFAKNILHSSGFRYINCGDWFGSYTYAVYKNGEFTLMNS